LYDDIDTVSLHMCKWQHVIGGLCACVDTAAVGSSTDDILPEIIIPPSATSCIESVDMSVKVECVANARLYIT